MTSLILALYLSAVPTITVSGKVLTPDGAGVARGTVTCRLTTPGTALDGSVQQRVAGEVTATITPSTGAVSIALVPNDAITPTGTRYTCTYRATLANGRAVQWAEQWQTRSSPATQDIGSVPVPTVPLYACMAAATPTFSMSSGSAQPESSLTIYANTPNSIIYYTSDGSTPTTSSTIYTGPIPLAQWSNETKTIKAIAVPLLGWTPSSVASVTLSIYWFAPMTTAGCYASPYTSGDTTLTVTRATAASSSDNSLSCASGELPVESDGMSSWHSATNYVLNSATHPKAGEPIGSITASATPLMVWAQGTGTFSVGAGTATLSANTCSSPVTAPATCTITVSGTGAPVVTTSAGITHLQVENQAVAAAAFPSPKIVTAGTATVRNAQLALQSASISALSLHTTNVWCRSITAKAYRPWVVSGLVAHPWAMGVVGSANSAYLQTTSGNMIFAVYNGSTVSNSVTWAMTGLTDSSSHRLTACNNAGTVSLCVDGVSVGTPTTNGDGLWTASPATSALGSNTASIRQWLGDLSNDKICPGVGTCGECP